MILFGVFLGLPSLVFAQAAPRTYYVSANGGSDSNPGTDIALPFKTINKAISLVNPGDTILVRGGTYGERVYLARSGTATQRITISAYASEAPTIDGSGFTFSSAGALFQIGSSSAPVSYISASGFVLQNSIQYPTDRGLNIYGNFDEVDNFSIHHIQYSGVNIRTSSNSTFKNSEVYQTVLCNENGKLGCGQSTWPSGVSVWESDHVKLLNNKVHNNWGEGMNSWKGTSFTQFIGNTIYDNWSVDLYMDHAHDSLVDRNFIYETDAAYSTSRSLPNAISIADETYTGYTCDATNNIIRNNIIINARRGVSFFSYQSCSGIKNTAIENNTIINTWEKAILISSGNHSGSIIKNNILFPRNSSNTSSFSGISTVANLTVDPKLINKDASFIPADPQNYKLTANSPAINAGAASGATSDFFGTPRDSAPDIGAHEYASTVPTPIPGDANGDGIVNSADLKFALVNWLVNSTSPADQNHDGKINSLDFATIVSFISSPSTSSLTVVAAGDIASSNTNDTDTAALVTSISPQMVLTLGDSVYESGTASEFNTYYDPTWGQFKSITHPVPGNHEYVTSGASGYFNYFGSQAGDPTKGYYSFNQSGWHFIALNSEISTSTGSAQEKWLRADLAANPTTCTLAYWHKPRFSSGTQHGSDITKTPLYQALYDYRADVILNGHEHNYERFAPQDANGVTTSQGVREFVVGTGGKSHYTLGTPIANSLIRDSSSYGVLKLILNPTSYSWQFVPVSGQTFTDSGTSACVT